MSLDKVVSLLVNLPFELRELILNQLSWRHVLHLRAVCKDLFHLVHTHGDGIAQNLIQHNKTVGEAYSLFFDIVTPAQPKFHLIFALLRRSSMVDHLAHTVAMHQYTLLSHNRGGNARAQETYTRQLNTAVRNLRPHLMIISHMLESYRSALAALVKDVDLLGMQRAAVSGIRVRAWKKELYIMRDNYNQNEICTTSLVFEHLKKIFCSRLRPASYATYVERCARGWTKPAATDEQLTSLMVFGGLEGISSIIDLPTYNKRIDALGDRLDHYTSSACTPAAAQPPPPQPGQNLPRIQQQLLLPLPQLTLDRMKTVLPDRVRFFNLSELSQLVDANSAGYHVPATTMMTDFLTELRSGDMAFEFPLRRQEPLEPVDDSGAQGVKKRPDRRRARLRVEV